MHKFHEATETPEGIYFILNNEEDRGQEVTHALNIAQVEVVHAVGKKDVVEQAQPWVLRPFIELVSPVSAAYISLNEASVAMKQ